MELLQQITESIWGDETESIWERSHQRGRVTVTNLERYIHASSETSETDHDDDIHAAAARSPATLNCRLMGPGVWGVVFVGFWAVGVSGFWVF